MSSILYNPEPRQPTGKCLTEVNRIFDNVTPKEFDRVTIHYPWHETPEVERQAIESRISPQTSDINTMSDLDLCIINPSQLPVVIGLKLQKRRHYLANMAMLNSGDYVFHDMPQSDDDQRQILDIMANYLRSLGIEPPPTKDTIGYQRWLSRTALLPGRVKRFDTKRQTDIPKHDTTWKISLSRQLATPENFQGEIFATLITDRHRNFTEIIKSIVVREMAAEANHVISYAEELVFSSDSRDHPGQTISPFKVVRSRIVDGSEQSGKITHLERQVGQPVDLLARKILDLLGE